MKKEIKMIIQESLFPEIFEETRNKSREKSKEKWLEQKSKIFGLEYCHNATFSGKYGIPLIKSYTGTIPEEYITFGEINPVGNSHCCVTGFDHDFIIDKLWDKPESYVATLSRYMCITDPDYSLKANHPLCVQIANTYRSHAIAFYMQEHSVPVLPSMSWSSTQSYEFCFDGHSKGGAVIVSTIGTLKNEKARMYFRRGFEEMLMRISPDAVILYGDVNDELLSWMPKQLDVHHFDHQRFKRARKDGR